MCFRSAGCERSLCAFRGIALRKDAIGAVGRHFALTPNGSEDEWLNFGLQCSVSVQCSANKRSETGEKKAITCKFIILVYRGSKTQAQKVPALRGLYQKDSKSQARKSRAEVETRKRKSKQTNRGIFLPLRIVLF